VYLWPWAGTTRTWMARKIGIKDNMMRKLEERILKND
jgi:hypothetical protein